VDEGREAGKHEHDDDDISALIIPFVVIFLVFSAALIFLQYYLRSLTKLL